MLNKKVRGAYGETDFGKKTIKINRARHRKPAQRITPNKDGTEKILATIQHEIEHVKDPKENSERKIENRAQRAVAKMSKGQKQSLYKTKYVRS